VWRAAHLPGAIAATRGKSNQAAIGIINFLLGWTLIGWIVALLMACTSHQMIGATMIQPMALAPVPYMPAMTAVGPAAGWYPIAGGQMGYWDGVRWTGHVQ
jgi:hypothetical protein